MIKPQKIKTFIIIAYLILTACAPNILPDRIKALDAPSFQNTPLITLPARSIHIHNDYKDNKFTADYGDHFALNPSQTLENYLKARFKPSGHGDALHFLITQASVIYIRENSGGQDDDVYAIEFDVSLAKQTGKNTFDIMKTVKHIQTSTQRRNIKTEKQRAQAQIEHFNKAIANFDKELVDAARSGRCVCKI